MFRLVPECMQRRNLLKSHTLIIYQYVDKITWLFLIGHLTTNEIGMRTNVHQMADDA